MYSLMPDCQPPESDFSGKKFTKIFIGKLAFREQSVFRPGERVDRLHPESTAALEAKKSVPPKSGRFAGAAG